MAGAGAGEVANPKVGDDLPRHNLGTGVGTGGGAAAGAALGAAGGPPGMIAGAAIGAAVGAAAGKGVARAVNPAAEDGYWRSAYVNTPYYIAGSTYDDYAPAYRLGYDGWYRYGGMYDDSERRLANEWESIKGTSRLTWAEAKHASRAAWDRVERAIPGDFDRDGK
jgi:hypothetical protein